MSKKGIIVPGIEPIRLQIGTFNCNLQGSSSVSPDLTHWLVPTVSEKSTAYNTSSNQDGRTAPDLYAVGFQELLPLHDGFANNEKAQESISKTDRLIRRAIRPQSALTRKDGMYPPGGGPEDYSLIASVHMVGIVLLVYARERTPETKNGVGTGISSLPSIAERVKEIRTATVGTGLLGLMGNKGAAGARIVLGGAVPGQPDEVITFITAHLAAHDHNVPRRNRDWKNIVTRMVFTPESVQNLPIPLTTSNKATPNQKDPSGITEKYETVHKSKSQKRKTKALDTESYGVYETSHLFVFGDLNYRIGFNVKPSPTLARKGNEGEKLKKSDVKRKIHQADWRTLATYDQLSTEHTHPSGSRVFQGLVEPDLRLVGYGPTYKYKVDKEARKKAEKVAAEKSGSELQDVIDDTSNSNVGVLSGKRVPGWTDRILWASNGAQSSDDTLHGVQLELLRSIMRYTHSDHKPVTAILRLPQPTGTLLAPKVRPFAIDSTWRTKQAIGTVLDRALGYIWCTLIIAGAGNVLLGIAELVTLAAIGVYWLGVGGGEQGDLGYWLGSVIGRP